MHNTLRIESKNLLKASSNLNHPANFHTDNSEEPLNSETLEPLNSETLEPLNFYTHKDPDGINFFPVLKQVPLNNATC
jgi:hypothetical protein